MQENVIAASVSALVPALEESVRLARVFLEGLDEAQARAVWRLAKGGRELMAVLGIGVVRVRQVEFIRQLLESASGVAPTAGRTLRAHSKR